MACPDENVLAELAAGTLPSAQLESTEGHLDGCPECRQVLAALLRMRASRLPAADSLTATLADPSKSEVLPNGALFERYLILERVGEGSLGTVYAAFDPRLERRVALKLLKAPAADESRREQMLREAQLMARVSHPNVLTVFDAGHVEDRVFLTLELVDGVNLRAWQAGRPSRREVLRRFLEAGEGLAAAHAQGLVHRDFKPDNVLVGRDGRVRVADFGLAAPLERGPAQERVGTPRYMAPEVLSGGTADTRSDQFSFCVALAEALTGRYPYEGSSIHALLNSMRGAGPQLPEGGLSRRVRRALLRGLSVVPAARHPSMDALLADLQPGLGAQRPLWIGAGALALAALLLVPWGVRRAGLCTGAAQRLTAVWDAPTREAVRTRFAATGFPHAGSAFERAAPVVDGWAAQWVSMHTAACEATRLRGEQSEAVLAARMGCLEHRWQSLEALTLLWKEADREVVLAAAASARALPAVEACADGVALTSASPPPADPQVRAEVTFLQAAVARAGSLLLAGRARQAKDLLVPLAPKARALGVRALEAELSAVLSEALAANSELEAAEKAALDAVDAAERSAEVRLMARTRLGLANVVAVRRLRRDDADRLFRSAQVAIERAGNAPALRAELEELQATFHLQVGLPALAHQEYLRALAHRERAAGKEDVSLAPALVGLARTSVFEKTLEPEWRAHLERALALQRRALGEEHPDIAQTLRIQGALFERFEDLPASLETTRSALTMYEHTRGDSVELAIAQDGYAIILLKAGRFEEAQAWEERALALVRRFLEPDHPSTLFILNNLIGIQIAQSRWSEAYRIADDILPRVEAKIGRGNLKWAALLMNYCLTGVLSGHTEVVAPRCLSDRPAVGGLLPKNVEPYWRLVIARLLANQGRFDEAFAIYRETEKEGDEPLRLNARVLAAMARVQARREPGQAAAFLKAEQARLEMGGSLERQLAAQIVAFLAEHGGR